MRTIDELDLILTLLRKHELPISPILEYAINEKKEALQDNCENRVDEVLVDGVKAEGVQLKERRTAFPLYMK